MSIIFDKETKTFYLESKGATYAFFINNFGYAEHLYYGKKIHRDVILYTRALGATSKLATVPGIDNVKGINSYNHMNPELAFFGTGDYREPTVHPKFKTGDRLTTLLYHSHEISSSKPKISGMPSMRGGETLIVHLFDEVKNFAADLYYTVYDDCDAIARRIVYTNLSSEDIILDRAYSFSMSLPGDSYEMLSLFGAWARERIIERTKLHHGVCSIDSKRAASSHTLNPFIAIVEEGTTETNGNAYGFNLIYSSSFIFKSEVTSNGETLITGGVNDFDFSWTLAPEESFETPEVLITYSPYGIGGMSREFHDAYRNHLIPEKSVNAPRPVLINNWEATYFDFDYNKLIAIADAVEGTGIDTLVLDDGWFGKRDDDRSGLGDWYVNEKKLSPGLDKVIEHVNSKGMKFGLWFEPEMINEDSDIFRAHPEYAIGVPDRKRCYSRHQYVMDLTRSDVRDYIVNSVNSILERYNIEYVKWDYNRNVTEFFSSGLERENQSEFSHRYALGLYDICDRIINANPDVFFEGCSGGGARFDPAMLAYFPQIWTSDDTDAEERTRIQYGTSLAYPLSSMSCHVSACPNHQVGRTTSFSTRGAIAHLGATGYELDTTTFTKEDKDAVKIQIQEYKKMEKLVLTSDLYRIENPLETNYFAFALVAKDKSSAHLTCYRRLAIPNPQAHRIIMQGLDPNKQYFCPQLGVILHGSTLMSVGIPVNYPNDDFAVKIFTFEEK